MKIVNVTPYLFFPGVAKNLLLCRVDTDEGIYGWGEAYVVQGKEKATETYILGMAPYMIGRRPLWKRWPRGQSRFQRWDLRR